MLRRLALLVLLAIPGHSWSAECPTTRCDLYHGFVTVSSSPSGTVGMNEPSSYQSRTDVSWNAPLGDLALVGTLISSLAFPSGEVATTDDFEILGAPPGVPVSVTVRLEGSGSNISIGFGTASFSGSLADAGGRIVTAG